jgi:hypothetical protein
VGGYRLPHLESASEGARRKSCGGDRRDQRGLRHGREEDGRGPQGLRADPDCELRVLKERAATPAAPRRPGLLLPAVGGQRFVPRPVLDAALKILHRRRRSPTGMANDPYDLANASTPTASCRSRAGRYQALAMRVAGLTDHVRDSWHAGCSPRGRSPVSPRGVDPTKERERVGGSASATGRPLVYSRSPTASRASSTLANICILIPCPSRSVHT